MASFMSPPYPYGTAVVERLGNMITMMSNSIGNYSSLERLSIESQKFGNRRRAIQWMKEVSHQPTLGNTYS